LKVLMEDLAARPNEARLILIETFSGGRVVQLQVDRGAGVLDQILGAMLPSTASPSISTRLARGITAGVTRAARAKLTAGTVTELPALAEPISAWIALLSGESLVDLRLDKPASISAEGTGSNERADGDGASNFGPPADGRTRILSAVVRLTASDGISALTLPRIRAQAGISRREFFSRFSSVRESFLDAIEEIAMREASKARASLNQAEDWEIGVTEAIRNLCTQAARNPALARLLFVEALETGSDGLVRSERLISTLAKGLRGLRGEGHGANHLSAEASSACAWQIAQTEVATGRVRDLPRIAPVLAYAVLAPL
jgi:AcrR family transcriptional regulator